MSRRRTAVQYTGANRASLVGMERNAARRPFRPLPPGISVRAGDGGIIVVSCSCGWNRAFTSQQAAVESGVEHSHARLDTIDASDEADPSDPGRTRPVIRSDAKQVNRLIGWTVRQDRDRRLLAMRAERIRIGEFDFWTWLEGRDTVVLCDICNYFGRDRDVPSIRRRLRKHAARQHG